MIQFKAVFRFLGVLLMIIGPMMMSASLFSWYYQSRDGQALIASGGISIAIGILFFLLSQKGSDHIGKREGYLVVVLGWMSMTLIGMLPYLISGVIPGLTDAFFETMSGLTTTGASILEDIESVPRGVLFWRSMTQWIGGMGIIVLTVALFPLLGIGGIELFVAEAPGPTSDRIHPRIRTTARALWLIYVALTAILTTLLYYTGMTFYDAINHGLTTMATGGFSTKNASIAYFSSPHIQYILILFMFLAGTNYTILYFGWRGRFKRIWGSDEFRSYVWLLIISAVVVSFFVYLDTDYSIEESFRNSLFQIVSIVTTTGYVSADYTSWSPALTMFFFILMFAGASAGSTSGGIKIIRHLVFVKNSILEFKRILHPRALIRIKIDHQVVAPRILTHILVFLLLYLLLFITGSILVSALGLDFKTAVGAIATCLGNVGPGIGEVGPVDNFAHLSPTIKWVLSVFMLLGRLELFTVLVLFMPYFWKKN